MFPYECITLTMNASKHEPIEFLLRHQLKAGTLVETAKISICKRLREAEPQSVSIIVLRKVQLVPARLCSRQPAPTMLRQNLNLEHRKTDWRQMWARSDKVEKVSSLSVGHTLQLIDEELIHLSDIVQKQDLDMMLSTRKAERCKDVQESEGEILDTEHATTMGAMQQS